ncbi:hypothetical protein Tco_0875208 [Tanacetum coccineum]|uniref:Uncharacterized protein n=1 Tax=Tanacetum coccineum TaxID=301880 RepID=A0ABQ5BRM6_9ASTR
MEILNPSHSYCQSSKMRGWNSFGRQPRPLPLTSTIQSVPDPTPFSVLPATSSSQVTNNTKPPPTEPNGILYLAESSVKSLEKELLETQHALGTEILQLNERIKKVPLKSDSRRYIVTPEKSKNTPSAQVNTGEVNAAQVNTGEVNAAEVNTGEAERVQRRKGKEPMTEEEPSS